MLDILVVQYKDAGVVDSVPGVVWRFSLLQLSFLSETGWGIIHSQTLVKLTSSSFPTKVVKSVRLINPQGNH